MNLKLLIGFLIGTKNLKLKVQFRMQSSKVKILKKIKSAFLKKRGFTVMETVVVLAIFSIAATYSLAIFVQSNQVQKRTANIQRALSDARYVLEVMAREVRMGHIDYSYYEEEGISLAQSNMPLPQGDEILAIRDVDNNPIRFQRAESSPDSERYVIKLYYEVGDEWLDITPEDLNITRLDFYISPEDDPFEWIFGGYLNNKQPRVTIVLETESLHFEGGADSESRLSHFQTTVTSRKYAR